VLTEPEAGVVGPRAVAKRRDDFLRGRWVAKQLLQRHLGGGAMLELAVLPDDRGVPIAYRAGARLDVSLSITHTRAYAAAAVVDLPWTVGIDAERYLENPALITSNYFTPAEQALAVDRRVSTTIWAAKEAVTKASGEGLRVSMHSIEIRAIGEPGADGWREVQLVSPQGKLPAWAWDEPDCVVCVVVAAEALTGRPVWQSLG
jgi:4'-phosphopantetheinyl transferase EntD